MKRQRSVFRTIVAPVVAAMVLFPTLAIAVWEVLHGRGAAVYSNVYGFTIHYTSVLIFLVSLLAEGRQMSCFGRPLRQRLTIGSSDRGVAATVSQGGSR